MKKFLCILALALLMGYGLFEARRIIAGPLIVIEMPQEGSATSSMAVVIRGVARNIAFLTINDRPAFTDEEGRFFERVSAPPGYTVFTAQGKDRFGRSNKAYVHITILNFCVA